MVVKKKKIEKNFKKSTKIDKKEKVEENNFQLKSLHKQFIQI